MSDKESVFLAVSTRTHEGVTSTAVVADHGQIADVDGAQRARLELESGIGALLQAFYEATGLWPKVTAGEPCRDGVLVDVEVRV